LNIDKNLRVLLISKDNFFRCNTRKAKGGMAVALYEPDSPKSHFSDTLKAGGHLNNKKAVEVLTTEVVDRINDLSSTGFLFDKNTDTGFFNLGLEGCHTHRRVLQSQGDRMGVEIFNFLFEQVQLKNNTYFMNHTEITDLNIVDSQLESVSIFSPIFGTQTLQCNSLVMASGGYSGIYQRNTSDSSFFGNIIPLAYKAGIGIADLEFMQFHPTVFVKDGFETLLMSEAIRGEGAILLNPEKKRFMDSYHPEAELASRDIVSRSMWEESLKCNSQDFYLDLRPIGEKTILNLFPEVYRNCLERKIDISKELVPVFPGAHYSMGGIHTDLFGKTSIDGIYAVGECGCNGTHGANRLASNSLIDSLVFGKRAAESLNNKTFSSSAVTQKKINTVATCTKPPFELNELKVMNWNTLGIEREKTSLEEYIQKLEPYMDSALVSIENNDKNRTNNEACLLSYLIAKAAIERAESRGAHYRKDYPNEDPTQAHSNLFIKKQNSSEPNIINLIGEKYETLH
jgi:L-aspartate oxidase